MLINFPQDVDEASYCIEHRGDAGSWILDWEYAASHQYKTFGNFPKTMIANQRFRPTRRQPYRLATAYRWQDGSCGTHTITRQGFCAVLKHLAITRIYIAGDSLSEAFSSSLRGLLGFPKWGSIQFVSRQWNFTCDNDYTVTHVFRRVQTENTDLARFFQQDLREHRRDFLVENQGRTVIVLNIGAHIHSISNFTRSFHSLLTAIDDLHRPQDIVFFRNTAPGHSNCLPREPLRQIDWSQPLADTPYRNYVEYKKHETTEHDWNLVERYNTIADSVLRQRGTSVTKIWRLNIFNATALRQDGHVGNDDCLHYSLPGPIDWWVHFWYSCLLDLATLERRTGKPAS